MNHKLYMDIARTVSEASNCVSHKVGAIIVKDGRIISTGYNGTPSGYTNCNEFCDSKGWSIDGVLNKDFRDLHSKWSSKHEIHAELNAILFAAKSGTSIDGSIMYVTLSPCHECAKAIINSGVKCIIYDKVYDKNTEDWDSILINQGISVIAFNEVWP